MRPPLSAVQLARLRRQEASTMVDRADITSKSRVSDGAGGSVVTPIVTADVPCRCSPRQAGESETPMAGQLFSGLQWLFAFPYDTAITTDDEITYQGDGFAVMAVLGPRTYELTRRVLAVEK